MQLIDAELEQIGTEQVLERVADFQPDLIGMTAKTSFFHRILALAKELKSRGNIPIIVGGQHVSILKADAMEECFDYLKRRMPH